MERGVKKNLVLLIGVIVLILTINVVLITAATPWEDFKSWISSSSDTESVWFAQGLLLALVSLLVYSIISHLPFLKDRGPFIKGAVSVIVGILSTLWLDTFEVKTILNSYETLGIVLTTFVPLVIMMAFTMELNKDGAKYQFLTRIMWIAFFIVISLKFSGPFYDYINSDGGSFTGGGSFGFIAYLITAIIALAMIIWERGILRLRQKWKVKGGIAKEESTTLAKLEGRIANLTQDRDAISDSNSESWKKLDKRIKELKAQVKTGFF